LRRGMQRLNQVYTRRFIRRHRRGARAPRWLQGDRARRGLPPIRCAGHRPALGVGAFARVDVARR
jgi:hypothetical protein